MNSLALVIATAGRPTLARTLTSLVGQDWRAGDEVQLVLDGPQPLTRELADQFAAALPLRVIEIPDGPHRDYGHTPRNRVAGSSHGYRCSWVAALDDDDVWTPGALASIRAAVTGAPRVPHLFRADLSALGLGVPWRDRMIRLGNVSTCCCVAPREVAAVCRYDTTVYAGDFPFIRDCAARAGGVVWRDEVIAVARPHAVPVAAYAPYDWPIPVSPPGLALPFGEV
jgi:hypothetical protein